MVANPATVGACQTRAQLSVLLLLNAVLTIFLKHVNVFVGRTQQANPASASPHIDF